MAVLVEGISIVVRRDAIVTKMSRGWDEFLRLVPNQTLCYDDNLVRVGFMTPMDNEAFSNILRKHRLIFVKNNKFIDYAVVDQREGLTISCDWLKFSHITFFDPPMTVAACEFINPVWEKREPGDNSIQIAFPANWNYEHSLSKEFHFVSTEEMPSKMKLLRHEDGVDVYLDTETGKKGFVGRTH